jgi:hypothetical protein
MTIRSRFNGMTDGHVHEASIPEMFIGRARLIVEVAPRSTSIVLMHEALTGRTVVEGGMERDVKMVREAIHNSRRGSFSRALIVEGESVMTRVGVSVLSVHSGYEFEMVASSEVAKVIEAMRAEFLEAADRAGVSSVNLEKMKSALNRAVLEFNNPHILFHERQSRQTATRANAPKSIVQSVVQGAKSVIGR